MMDEKKSFWATLPGVLTGIAMIITAIGGLIGGLYAAGIIGGQSPSPTIAYSPSSLSFTATTGFTNPTSNNLGIRNSGSGALEWSVSDSGTWLELTPVSGIAIEEEEDEVKVLVDISGMSVGDYNATITISAKGATNTPQTVPVNLTIFPGEIIP